MGHQTVITAAAHLAPSPASTFDITRCEDEQIRIPGSIQTHGFLLMLDELTNQVMAASENTEEFLGIPLKLVLGASLETLIEMEACNAIQKLSQFAPAIDAITYLGSFRIRQDFFSIVTHTLAGHRVIEFEKLDRLVNPELMNGVVTNFVGKLSRISSTDALCEAIVEQVKELTEFDRVLLYCFDEVGHGTVLCELNEGPFPSYLDLRFPASDIPPQARALYLKNTIRCIPNAAYTPSPLIGLPAFVVKTLDLSDSILRSVSPVHLEYMRNMGTFASMSISIVSEGRLWGLISAHNSTPKGVPYLIRSACDLLTKVVATQLGAFRAKAQLKAKVHFHAVHRGILTQMAADNGYVSAMESQIQDLMKVTDADGIATLVNGRLHRAGDTPDDETVMRIVAWLDTMEDLECLVSQHLGRDLEWMDRWKKVASGMVAIRISEVKRSYILWFRPEIIQTVKWAGEPLSPANKVDHLHPRLSFAIWEETVRGRSSPWNEMEIESAGDFRMDILKIILKRAEEAGYLSDARFHQLTQAIPTLVWTSDDDGQLTFVNQGWVEQGLQSEGCWLDTKEIVEDDAIRCREQWAKAVAEGILFEEEIRLRVGSHGTERWYLIRAVPFKRTDGTRAGWVGTFTDLTDRRERELALRITEKLALTERMTSVTAHEINNPLESIINLLYLLRGNMDGDQVAQEYLTMAEIELERISGITKQTLRWSRESTQEPEWTSAQSIFEDTLRLFKGKIKNREVTASILTGMELPVYGVRGQLRQVIANLFSNALDAVPVAGQVAMMARETDFGTELIVRDAGTGMTRDEREQIFQPFYSTKGDLGNGLGLYISHEIVERHGGTLTVESEIGQGTTVTVHLPSPVLEDQN